MSLKQVYEAIEDIASESSRLIKEEKIKKYLNIPYFKKVIMYAYDYNKKFNVTNVNFINHKYEIDLDILFQYLDHLSTLNGATQEIKNNLNILSSIDKETNILINRIVNKDLKCGANIVTFKKFIPELPVFEIMTCQKDIDKFLKLAKQKEYFWSEKKDGTRVINIVNDNCVDSHFSRSGLEYPNFGIFDNDLIKFGKILNQKYNFPYPIYIDGESISSNGSFNKIMTQIRRKKNVDVNSFKFYVFDIPSNLEFEKRYNIIEEIFNENKFDRLKLIKHFKCNYDKPSLLNLSKKIVKEGCEGIDEGIVIKIANSPYEWKEHSKYWCKIKPTNTLDLPVTGFYFGKKGTKYENIVGGLVVEFNNKEVHVGSGLSDEQRVEFLEELPEIIEVEYKEVTKDGSLREPIMIRIRDDKNITD